MATLPLIQEVDYPESDGRPLAETEFHGIVMLDLLSGLRWHFASVPDVYVWGNMCFYYEEANPNAFLSPDVFLVHGTGKQLRRTYKLWEEGRVPSLVIEVTSKSTRDEDLKIKKGIYERLGVEEYFLFDPLEEYLRPRLQGYRRVSGRYVPMAPEADGSLASVTTGLRLVPEGRRLRLRDAVSGEPLLWYEELAAAHQAAEDRAAAQTRRAEKEMQAREAAEERRAQEARAREAAEERVRRLEAELLRLRGNSAG